MKLKSARIKDFTVYFQNQKEFHILKREIFGAHQYYVEFDKQNPYIIDAGAHIGLSTLYFKSIAPYSTILAIEPNPEILPILEKNIWENQLDDVTVEPVALSSSVGQQPFYLDATDDNWYSTAGFTQGAWNRSQESQEIQVPTRPLSDFIRRPVDLLKLDIEAAETEVIFSAQSHLHNIDHLIIEFHGVGDNSLSTLVEVLTENKFTVEVTKAHKITSPKLYPKLTGLSLIEAHQQ